MGLTGGVWAAEKYGLLGNVLGLPPKASKVYQLFCRALACCSTVAPHASSFALSSFEISKVHLLNEPRFVLCRTELLPTSTTKRLGRTLHLCWMLRTMTMVPLLLTVQAMRRATTDCTLLFNSSCLSARQAHMVQSLCDLHGILLEHTVKRMVQEVQMVPP